MSCRGWAAGVVLLVGALATGSAAAAQQTALKGGVAVSRFDATGQTYWDDRLVTTGFGGHIRYRFGPISLQPELLVLTKGATASAAPEDEQLRLEYLELPLLVVLPVQVGRLEPVVFAGPAIMLESRCRWVVREGGLRSNLGCDPPRDQLFRRTQFDYGVAAGGGASYPVGGGRILVEARHTWGLRDIHRDAGPEIRNRTFAFLVGYTLNWLADEPR
jgi:hypothetical protein